MLLREKYKIDPVFAEKVNAQYGPLDWRLPEAHAIYWGAFGLEKARENPGKVKADDLITLRRNIYQSMLYAFYHGRFIANPFNQSYELGPNLDLIPKVNDAYETLMGEDPKYTDNVATAHRNFLRNAVYFLYEDNRLAEAAKWLHYLGERYPDKPIIDRDPDSFPRNVTLDQYAVARVQEDIGETSEERTTAAVEGLLVQAYRALALDRTTAMPDFGCWPPRYTNITWQPFPTGKPTWYASACHPLPISIAPCSTICSTRNGVRRTPPAPSSGRNWACRRKPMRRQPLPPTRRCRFPRCQPIRRPPIRPANDSVNVTSDLRLE